MSAAIATEGLTVRFGDVTAVENVTVTVPQDAFIAIIGPNGAGKTTFLQTVLGLHKPTAGTVRLFGKKPWQVSFRDVGFVPQLKTLDRTFPSQAIELVVTGLRRRWPWRITDNEREQALHAMKRTGVDHLPERPLPKLSGGELQRAYLARALVRRPRLMVLDEPAAGMDMAGEAEMYHILHHYQEEADATVLMITHDWEGARYHATHLMLFEQGVVTFGAPDDVGAEERLLEVFGHKGHVAATHPEDGHA